MSEDGTNWTKAAAVTDNSKAWNDVRFQPVTGAYVRITITDPGSDGIARIADIDIFGNGNTDHARCPQCGRIHNDNFFDSIVGAFHRIFYCLTHLFG